MRLFLLLLFSGCEHGYSKIEKGEMEMASLFQLR